MLPPEVQLHYAMKANPMPALVGFMARLVDGLDVASAASCGSRSTPACDRARSASPGPARARPSCAQAVAAGVLVNVESMREVELLAADLAPSSACTARVAVRVNPDFELKSSGMKMGGGPKQFGIDAEQVPRAARRASVAAASPSRASTSSRLAEPARRSDLRGAAKALELALRLAAARARAGAVAQPGRRLRHSLLPRRASRSTWRRSASNLRGLVERGRQRLARRRQLVIELGRYLVGEAGVYVAA